MNANELADDLLKNGGNCSWFKEIATMLRQQQAELDAFKLQYYNTGYSIQLRDKDETIRQQQAEIEKLEAQAKAKNNYLDQHCQKIDALHNLVKEQDKKIIDLAFRAVYAERSAQLAYDPKKHGAEE